MGSSAQETIMLQVCARNISKRYTGRYIIRDLSLDAHAGEIVCLTGHNGSGKTTLLKMLCGLLRPTRGTVTIATAAGEQPAPDVRRTLGIQTPHVRLYDELTANENLDFLLQVRGLMPDAARKAALLERLDVAEAANRPVGDLSSGMKQRLCLAAALIHDPPALFLDEPTSFLDESGRARVTDLIQELRHSKLVVVATNDPREQAWGDRIIELGR